MAAYLGMKKDSPFGLGTLLFATIIIVGALLFLPIAALGPFAEHLGPMLFEG